MNKKMEKKLLSMNKQEKKKLMEFYFGGDPKEKSEGNHEYMPIMMEDCMSEMSEEERKNVLGFCRGMLDKVEKKFSL